MINRTTWGKLDGNGGSQCNLEDLEAEVKSSKTVTLQFLEVAV